MKVYNIYTTDTFGGELNYCWVIKYRVRANTERGAVCKVSRLTGFKLRHHYDEVWIDRGNCIGLVIDQDDQDYPQYDYSNIAII